MITKNCSEIFWGSEYLLLVPHLCYKVMQYSKLVLVLLLPLSSSSLQRTKTVLLLSTHLLKKFRYSFLCSLLMSSTAVLSWRRCDSLYYLAVLSLHRTSFFDTFDSLKPSFALPSKMFCSWTSFKSAIDYFISLSRNLVSFLSHSHWYFQIFKVVVWHETTKSCRFEAFISNFKVQLNFSLII